MSRRRERVERMEKVNSFLRFIGSRGRNFFYDPDQYGFAYFSIDHRERIWFHDSYTGARIYTHQHYLEKGFTGGGTLNALVRMLAKYIQHGKKLCVDNGSIFGRMIFSGKGDLWGYGDAHMEEVRKFAVENGIGEEDSTS